MPGAVTPAAAVSSGNNILGVSLPLGVGQDRVGPFPYQDRVLAFYTNQWTQIVVAALIVFNFIQNIVEKEIDPFGASRAVVLYGLLVDPC